MKAKKKVQDEPVLAMPQVQVLPEWAQGRVVVLPQDG